MTTKSNRAVPDKRYKHSVKRSVTRDAGAARLRAAAWQIFSTIGFDASTVRDIVAASGLSQGSFYNYGGTREKLFDALLTDLIDKVRVVTAAARSEGLTVYGTLESSYRAMLEFILAIDGARQFCELNQHHVRAKVASSPATAGLLADLRADIHRLLPDNSMTAGELALLGRLILATGLETLISIPSEDEPDVPARARFIARLLSDGMTLHASKT